MSKSINIIGLLLAFLGAITVANTVFRQIILSNYCKAHWGDKKPSWLFRILGKIFINKNINKIWLDMLRSDLTEEEEKELRDPYIILRAIIYIFLGMILQIISFFV